MQMLAVDFGRTLVYGVCSRSVLSAERITSFVGDVSLVHLELQQVGREDNSWRIDRPVCTVIKPADWLAGTARLRRTNRLAGESTSSCPEY